MRQLQQGRIEDDTLRVTHFGDRLYQAVILCFTALRVKRAGRLGQPAYRWTLRAHRAGRVPLSGVSQTTRGVVPPSSSSISIPVYNNGGVPRTNRGRPEASQNSSPP